MQAAAVLTLAALAVLAPAAGAAPLAFREPGEFSAAWVGSQEATWALLVFRNGTTADFGVLSDNSAKLRTETLVRTAHVERERDGWTAYQDSESNEQRMQAPFEVVSSFLANRPGSLFVAADQIRLDLHGAQGLLASKGAGESLRAFYRYDDQLNHLYQPHGQEAGESVVIAARATSPGPEVAFSLNAEGASHVEWFNAAVMCENASPCPQGGGSEIWASPTVGGYRATNERHTYESLLGKGMDLQGRGTVDYVLFGSSRLTLGVDGTLRLPLSSGDGGSCAACILPDNQTFAATGNITLGDLQRGQGGLTAETTGDLKAARFDELVVDPSSILGAQVAIGTVAVGGGLAILWKFLSVLFTRRKEVGPLANERRRRLYEYVVKHPGIHFREALRGAGVPSGSGRHHITKLVQAGLLIERRHRNSVCLFENSERFNRSWHDFAALRDPDQRLLHDWLQSNPGTPQKAVVLAFAELHGWARSATQARLERLVSDGLASSRFQGQFRLFTAVKPGFPGEGLAGAPAERQTMQAAA